MKRQIALTEPIVKKIKEVSLLTGKSEEELITEALQAYIFYRYGIEDLERYNLADVLRIFRAMSMMSRLEMEVINARMGLSPKVEIAPQVKESEVIDEIRSELKELGDRIVETLRELKKEREEAKGTERTTSPINISPMRETFSEMLKGIDDLIRLMMSHYISMVKHDMVERIRSSVKK